MGARRALRSTSAFTALALGAALATASPATVGAAPRPPDTIVLVPYDGTTTALVHSGATTTASYIPATGGIVEGNFSSAPGSDVLVYGQGDDPDGIIHVTPTYPGVTTSFRAETIYSRYVPLVGDYDGNGIDDVFWYGAGNNPDSIWSFQPDGSHEIVHYNVWGHFRPVALDADGDGHDDILWYGPGRAVDSLWLFGEGGSYAKRTVTVSGDYEPLVGQFQQVPSGHPRDQIVWHDRRGPDSLWSFTPTASHTSRPLPNVDGAASPVAGTFLSGFQDSIFWYAPGSAPEYVTTFDPEHGPLRVSAPAVNGSYTPVVGDFNAGGPEEIAWTSAGRLDIWQLRSLGTGRTQTWISTPYPRTVPAVTRIPDEPT